MTGQAHTHQQGCSDLWRWWMPWLGIIAASALAHIWCTGAQFYLDDFPQIVDSTTLSHEQFWSVSMLVWTNFWYWMQFKVFGCSAPAIHAVNWCLHTTSACLLFAFARDFPGMQGKRGVAFFAALLFAVHPLGSEIPNYARTQDLAWVTLFSLLACWLLVRLANGGSRWNGAGIILAVLGAACSKGPGIFHALMACGVVAVALMPRGYGQRARQHMGKIALAIGCLVLIIATFGWFGRILCFFDTCSEPRFAGHALTLCRVFWEFAWRAVLPIHLCADHHIAETLVPSGVHWWQVPDKIALFSALSFGLFLCASLALARRSSTRLPGICLLLFGFTILFRMLFLVPEFMPEYRIYPGLPWFCLAAAITLAAGWQRWIKFSPVPAAMILLLGFSWLSAQRSLLWHDLGALMADVLHQYPTQSRAIWILQARDARAGRWQQVIDRHQQALPAVDTALQQTNKSLAPARELPTGHHALAMIGCISLNARAMAMLHGPADGLRILAGLDANMRTLQPPPQKIHWSLVTHARGLILEQAGDYQGAIRELTLEDGATNTRLIDLERVQRKLADQPQTGQ